jgi:PhnB protein
MKEQLIAYLNFDGNCRQAMTFYQKCLGGELHVIPFSDMPGGNVPAEAKDRLAHARLKNGGRVLMASDTMPGMPFQQGNASWIMVWCESLPEIEKAFKAFSENAKTIGMPLQETFWAARYGNLTDQFGVNWMFNLDKTVSA